MIKSKQTQLAGIPISLNGPVRIMGVINASPESFYKESVRTTMRTISKQAQKMTEEGADFIDIGAQSTAPYLKTLISEREEIRRMTAAISAVKSATKCPISADTVHSQTALAALNAGALIINDISGLSADSEMGQVARQAQGVVLMANPLWMKNPLKSPLSNINQIFGKIIEKARQSRIAKNHIVLDPGIGFFRNAEIAWWKWDLAILKGLNELQLRGFPLLVGVSRKSFIGEILSEKDPKNRLFGSLAATTTAVINGAAIIRTHDVEQTKKAILIAQALRDLKTTRIQTKLRA